MLSSNEIYYTDESAQGKNFFKKFSDLVIGDVLKRLVIQERPQRLHQGNADALATSASGRQGEQIGMKRGRHRPSGHAALFE